MPTLGFRPRLASTRCSAGFESVPCLVMQQTSRSHIPLFGSQCACILPPSYVWYAQIWASVLEAQTGSRAGGGASRRRRSSFKPAMVADKATLAEAGNSTDVKTSTDRTAAAAKFRAGVACGGRSVRGVIASSQVGGVVHTDSRPTLGIVGVAFEWATGLFVVSTR